ncbi:MAG TPA: efflux RND transporter periplasmic adaptor subunit [Gemmataceae bacterium]|nr:efflux RND transporter periplasmic adaptor subunit [Gemmataceae bacterium]
MRILRLLAILVVVAAIGAGGWWYLFAKDNNKSKFRTAAAERGELLATINATGTIEAEENIDIGAQVQGMIKEFGKDPKDPNKTIDYGSEVEENTVLAQIDPSLYKAAVDQAAANLHQAEANVLQAKANLISLQSKQKQTKRDWDRVQKLAPSKAISDLDIDTAESASEIADAAVHVGDASLEAAKKQVEVAQAQLQTAKINLAYCTIKSPVKGVVVTRRVNIGQTVVSSLSAPSLFLLAKDLRRLQVWASVNEADIGHLRTGQPVTFAVDAFAGQKFKGTILQIRLNATMTQNVVTYTVVVSTDNSDGKLLPYMTANLDFEIDRHPNALLVPNAALRWQPAPQQVAPDARADFVKTLRAAKGTPEGKPPEKAKDGHDRGRVWVEDGEFVRPVKVRTGLSDGTMTEITGGDLQEGTPVVIGESHENNASSGTSNPFTPQMFKNKGQ